MKYRKKPIVVEAMQLTRKFFSVVRDWMPDEDVLEYNTGEFPEDACYIEINTREGVMVASEEDWIIKGIKGEFYACKPDIFALSYEAVIGDE